MRDSQTTSIPLSAGQARLWFLSRLKGHRPNYNETVVMGFREPCDVGALQAAVGDVVARHAVLRTVFPESQGTPYQVVLSSEADPPPFIVHETSPARLRRDIADAAKAEFDLTTEPPLRTHLFGVQSHRVLLMVIHHIAVDWWSIHRVLVRDLLRAYHSRCAGKVATFAPLPMQYVDYAAAQAAALADGADSDSPLARQLGFWKAALRGLPDELQLPRDYARREAPTFEGGSVDFRVEPSLHAAFAGLARRERSSLFMAFHALLATLFTRLGAGTDIAIGSPVSGRKTRDVEGLVGFFANTIVVRTSTANSPTFRELLARVRRTVLEACRNDEVPFERVVEAINPARALERNPLFQVLLGVRTVTVRRGRVAFRGRRARATHAEYARFDLAVDVRDQHGVDRSPLGMIVTLRYSTDLFHHNTAALMVQRLLSLMRSVVAHPDVPIDEIDVLTPGERERFAAGREAVPPDAPGLVELIETQAEQAPDDPAVHGEDGFLSRRDLNAKANQLAALLAGEGVGVEDVVGIALPRRAGLVVALLAVLKSGAASLLIDPEAPAEHTAAMVQVAKPALILTTWTIARGLPDGTRHLLLDESAVDTWLSTFPTKGPAEQRSGLRDAAAAVVFTAGTTGTPMGVVVPRYVLTQTVSAFRTAVPTAAGAASVATVPIGADVALVELLVPLAAGRPLVLAADETLLYPGRLERLLESTTAAVLHGTPRRLRELSRHTRNSRSKVTLLVGRDSAPPADLISPLSRTGAELHHLYGTTETATWNAIGPLAADRSVTPPVGYPLSHSRIAILDHRLRPLPAGVVGDVYIGGDAVARGYVATPGLTAARFVASRVGHAGARMFRTGDRGRWAHDGRLVITGRADDPMAGTERTANALRAIPGVVEAVVMRRRSSTGQPCLVGYAAVGADDVSGESLRAALDAVLPRDAAPDVVVTLDRLPLLPNGSLDRLALPLPAVAPSARAPSDLEACVRQLFADVLGSEEIGLDDSFFDRGGQSLGVMKLINRIRSVLGLEVDVRTVFEAQTVSALCRRMTAMSGDEALPMTIPSGEYS